MDSYPAEIEKMLAEQPELRGRVEAIDFSRVPRHVAVIMDGNGRWAKRHGLPRTAGHVEGVNAVRRITEIASDLGVGNLTLYAFSTENWKRPQEEVDALMELIGIAIEQQLPDLIANNVRIKLVGAIGRMPEKAQRRLYGAVDKTSHCTGMTLAICLNYGSRQEITRAAQEAAKAFALKVASGEIKPEEISESVIDEVTEYSIDQNLYTAGMPDPDLLIRTGGEMRISNYLLWQIAYTELNVSQILWPEYSKADFLEAVADFQNRERRFGKTSEQVSPQPGAAPAPIQSEAQDKNR